MRLAQYCRSQPGYLLLPGEHLSASGADAELAGFLRDDLGWSAHKRDFLDRSVALYCSRSESISARTEAWPKPRIRNLGIAESDSGVRPYAQVLNTSTWTIYDCDVDPEISHEELAAYVLALADWMSMTGEVSEVPMRSAAWWIECGQGDVQSFVEAASCSKRPDAEMLCAVAESTSWLSLLHHRDLKPAPEQTVVRGIPGTGLQVAANIEAGPPELVERCRRSALSAVDAYRRRWQGHDDSRVASLLEWLAASRPMLVVAGDSGRTLWDCAEPQRTDELADCLSRADPVAVEAVRADLEIIDEHSRRFMAALVDADSLPHPRNELAESGYAYVHPRRRVIAYNLFEAGMERTVGPPLPFEREMLGARTLHEWGHLADEAGWVTARSQHTEMARLREALAAELQAAVEECCPQRAGEAVADLTDMAGDGPAGEALAEVLLARLPDYRANLVAGPFMTPAERETYVRHNIRTFRYEYSPHKLWRMLSRYLYEYQYLLPQLGLTDIEDPYGYFAASTGFETDVIDTGVLRQQRFESITAALSELCSRYSIDRDRIRVEPAD